jgi:Tat protein translocase TatB subunit
MPQVGPMEIMLVMVLALIVYGPEKLPEIARTVGKTLADFRRVVDDAKGEFEAGLHFDEEDEPSDHPIREALDSPERRQPPRVTYDLDPEGSDSSRPGLDSSPIPDRSQGAYSASLSPIPTTLDPARPREEPDDV